MRLGRNEHSQRLNLHMYYYHNRIGLVMTNRILWDLLPRESKWKEEEKSFLRIFDLCFLVLLVKLLWSNRFWSLDKHKLCRRRLDHRMDSKSRHLNKFSSFSFSFSLWFFYRWNRPDRCRPNSSMRDQIDRLHVFLRSNLFESTDANRTKQFQKRKN